LATSSVPPLFDTLPITLIQYAPCPLLLTQMWKATNSGWFAPGSFIIVPGAFWSWWLILQSSGIRQLACMN
jgi:hypothetical protein